MVIVIPASLLMVTSKLDRKSSRTYLLSAVYDWLTKTDPSLFQYNHHGDDGRLHNYEKLLTFLEAQVDQLAQNYSKSTPLSYGSLWLEFVSRSERLNKVGRYANRHLVAQLSAKAEEKKSSVRFYEVKDILIRAWYNKVLLPDQCVVKMLLATIEELLQGKQVDVPALKLSVEALFQLPSCPCFKTITTALLWCRFVRHYSSLSWISSVSY